MNIDITTQQARNQMAAYDAAVRMLAQTLQQQGLQGAAQATQSLHAVMELAKIAQSVIEAKTEIDP